MGADRSGDGLGEQISQICRKIISEFSESDSIRPAYVADRVMEELDPDGGSPVLVRYSSTLELRQRARGILRELYVDPSDHEQDMFDSLPQRIPKMDTEGGTEEPEYIPRLQATLAERRAYSSMLAHHIMARIKRKDNFDAETEELIRMGHFGDEE